jgi:hypothetical protein
MTTPVLLDVEAADEANASDPAFSQQAAKSRSAYRTLSGDPIMLDNTDDLCKNQSIAQSDYSFAYAPHPSIFPPFTTTAIASLPSTYPVALIYNPVASGQQPIWNYITHPPSNSVFAIPGIANPLAYAQPNTNVHPISPAHFKPPTPCLLTRRQPPTQQIPLDDMLVERRCADATKQRSKMQGLAEAKEQEQKNNLKLFKETPSEERGGWPLEVSTFS